MPDIKIGKFDILATYTYAQALLHDVPDAEARQCGIVAAIIGAKARSGGFAGVSLCFWFWLASPRATRGQGQHPEFCWLSRGAGTSSGRLAPYNSASSALMSKHAARRLAGS
jgi:hypothetical protein